MLQGTFASLMFFAFIGLGYKLHKFLESDKNPWSDKYIRPDLPYFAILIFSWFIMSIGFIFASIITISECGTLGTFLILWSYASLAMMLFSVIFVIFLISVISMGFFLDGLFDRLPSLTSYTNVHDKFFEGVLSPYAPLINPYRITMVVSVSLFVGYLGTFNDPRCGDEIEIQTTLELDRSEIALILKEHNPELLTSFEELTRCGNN